MSRQTSSGKVVIDKSSEELAQELVSIDLFDINIILLESFVSKNLLDVNCSASID